MTSATSTPAAQAAAAAGSLKGVVAAPTSIATVNGEEGKLIYRGYSIEDLAANVSFEETVYLLWEGELPNRQQLQGFTQRLAAGRKLPPQIVQHLRLIPKESHPLAVLRSGVSLLSHYDPQAEAMDHASTIAKAERLVGQVPAIVCAWARLREGQEPVEPRPELSAAANFMWMLRGQEPDEQTVKAMDVAFTLHAEHEFNASTFAARVAAGTFVDLHSCMVAAIAALKGPRHGGANEDVIDLVREIGTADNAEKFTRGRLARYHAATREERANPNLRFPGMGHAVYRTLDPRARVLSGMAATVAEVHGTQYIPQIQETVRRLVTEDLKIYPNVDYYSAGLYFALGIPTDLYTSIFAVARTPGWIAHIVEQLEGGRLIRPRAEYTGPAERPVKPIDQR